jgi:hypothetical protein
MDNVLFTGGGGYTTSYLMPCFTLKRVDLRDGASSSLDFRLI